MATANTKPEMNLYEEELWASVEAEMDKAVAANFDNGYKDTALERWIVLNNSYVNHLNQGRLVVQLPGEFASTLIPRDDKKVLVKRNLRLLKDELTAACVYPSTTRVRVFVGSGNTRLMAVLLASKNENTVRDVEEYIRGLKNSLKEANASNERLLAENERLSAEFAELKAKFAELKAKFEAHLATCGHGAGGSQEKA